jgi:two-component system sensor histidine kinase KdpD
VLGASALGGRLVGITLAFIAFFLFNWFFLVPYGTLYVADPLDWLVLLAFLVTSMVAAQLLYRADAQRAALASAAAAREADRMKDALVASVSHDLRTPLTTIKALAHELHGLGDERTYIIEEQADRLNRIVTDLLDSARLDAGNLPFDIQVNAADELLGAVSEEFAGRPDRHRLALSLDDPASLSFGRFDFVHTLRIVANLVDNALKFSPVDSVVTLTAGAEGDSLVFRVADRGPGIRAEERERIFKPFARKPGDTGTGHAAGMGLSIARRLAEAQAGSLVCKEREGGGAVFELRLPAVQPEGAV